MKAVQSNDIPLDGCKCLFVLAAPCVTMDYGRPLAIGNRATEICQRFGVPDIF